MYWACSGASTAARAVVTGMQQLGASSRAGSGGLTWHCCIASQTSGWVSAAAYWLARAVHCSALRACAPPGPPGPPSPLGMPIPHPVRVSTSAQVLSLEISTRATI